MKCREIATQSTDQNSRDRWFKSAPETSMFCQLRTENNIYFLGSLGELLFIIALPTESRSLEGLEEGWLFTGIRAGDPTEVNLGCNCKPF